MGCEEVNFINMILKKLANRESPYDILKKVETTVKAELKAKHGHIAVGVGVKVGLDGKPVAGGFAEWSF